MPRESKEIIEFNHFGICLFIRIGIGIQNFTSKKSVMCNIRNYPMRLSIFLKYTFQWVTKLGKKTMAEWLSQTFQAFLLRAVPFMRWFPSISGLDFLLNCIVFMWSSDSCKCWNLERMWRLCWMKWECWVKGNLHRRQLSWFSWRNRYCLSQCHIGVKHLSGVRTSKRTSAT